MRILLDTHSFLWFSTDDRQLSATAKSVIEDPGNDKLLSVAVGWEMAIKVSLGKLTVTGPIDAILNQALAKTHWELLGIEVAHLAAVSTLKFHHKDPFDRLLIAQSLVEDTPIVSKDPEFDAYGVEREW